MAKKKKNTPNNKGIKVFNGLLISLFVIFLVFLYQNGALNISFKSTDNFLNSIKNIGKTNNDNNFTTATDGDLYVYFMDVGQADSILLSNSNEYMLIDAGNNEDGALLVNYFKSMNIEKFNYVFGTHAHEDHIGGMDDIINNFSVSNFYMPDAITTTKTYEDVLDALNYKNVRYQIPKKGDSYSLGSAVVKVLHVDNGNDLNDTSVVLKVNYGNTCFLFMGDASTNVEKKLNKNDLTCDVLKIGHHGSHYSNSLEFIQNVKPKYGIISVGKNNIYKHPSDNVLKILKDNNITIYRTDEKGTIVAKSSGDNITFDFLATNTNG